MVTVIADPSSANYLLHCGDSRVRAPHAKCISLTIIGRCFFRKVPAYVTIAFLSLHALRVEGRLCR